MEELSHDSVSSIMSLDNSDSSNSTDTFSNTASYDQDKKIVKHCVTSTGNKAAKTAPKEAGHFSQMLEPLHDDDDDDDDDDLKELDSSVLSAQITKVVTKLEPCLEDVKAVQTVSYGEKFVDLTAENEQEISEINRVTDDASDFGNHNHAHKVINNEREDTEDINNVNDRFSDVQIKVIDVPDDDDLFDFLNEHTAPDNQEEASAHISSSSKQTSDDLKKCELYRYLTVSDPTLIRSNEATPHQSGDENNSDEETGTDRSGSTEDISSESESEVEQVGHPHLVPEESQQAAPVHEEPQEESVVKARRKPGPRPKVEKATKKPQRAPGQLSERTIEKLEKCREATNKWLQDLKVPEELKFEKPLTLDIADLNQYLTCGLCKGYLYEASTITECMHTFCKNCIVRHCMEVSLHCPVCNILIHPTDPFVHIRLDRMLQDIVYKILPSVADNEFRNMQEFYEAHPEVDPKDIPDPPAEPKTSPRDKESRSPKHQTKMVSLILEAEGDHVEEDVESLRKKYVRVSSCATVSNVCTFLRKKLNLEDSKQVELYCSGNAMEQKDFTLENIQHKFFGDEDCLMLLQYRVQDV